MTPKITTTNALAVIELSGKQYIVKEGDKIKAEKLDVKEGDKLKVDTVLLVSVGSDVQVGTPYVEKASVELVLDRTVKDEKVQIQKFRAKSRYRRSTGHRQIVSYLTVTGINLK